MLNGIMVDAVRQKNDDQANIIKTANNTNAMLKEVVKQIELVSNNFAIQANDQASAISQVNTAMSQIRDISRETVSSVAETSDVAKETKDESLQNRALIQSLEGGFNEVVEINKNAQEEFDELAAQAEGIEDVVRSNREIAGQIKILSTNAAIQAAKAGEYGRGFRVVAVSLKTMIQRTEDSLEHSGKLLEDIRNRAKQSSETVRHSAVLLGRQYTELRNSGSAMEGMAKRFSDTAEKVEGVVDAARQQQIRLDDVVQNMEMINKGATELHRSTAVLVDSVEKIIHSYRTLESVLVTE